MPKPQSRAPVDAHAAVRIRRRRDECVDGRRKLERPGVTPDLAALLNYLEQVGALGRAPVRHDLDVVIRKERDVGDVDIGDDLGRTQSGRPVDSTAARICPAGDSPPKPEPSISTSRLTVP